MSGESWGPSRNLIASKYHLETVVSSHDAERQNFSENTDLSEVLIVARRLPLRRQAEWVGPTTYINLWRNPRTIYEAMDLANQIKEAGKPVSVDEAGLTNIVGASGKLGEIVSMPAARGEANWTGALFAQTELLRAFVGLHGGRLSVPGKKGAARIPVCRMSELGSLGPDRKRISEGFKVSTDDWSPYPAFWGHDSTRDRTIRQSPNARLLVWRESPRGPNYGPHLWERAGRILLVERLRTNTHRVIAIGLDEDVLGNTWWAFKPNIEKDGRERALLLWLNSTLSMLLFFGSRVVTQGAWMQMKQPAWESMTVLDVRSLGPEQVSKLSDAYESLCDQELSPLAQLGSDPVRRRIDAALSEALGLPDLGAIRELFVREPGLTAKEINPHDEGREAEEERIA